MPRGNSDGQVNPEGNKKLEEDHISTKENLTAYSCFQAKFVDTIVVCFYTHSPYFCKKVKPYTLALQ